MCKTVVVVKRTGGKIDWVEGRDYWYHDITSVQSEECQPEEMNAEDPLFILYTSGFNRETQGCNAYLGGLYSLRFNDP